MKVLVAGTRKLEPTFEQLGAALEMLAIRVDQVSAFVSGLCPNSPDMLPFRFTEFYNYNIPIEPYPADWTKGRWAGLARNKVMADVADVGIVFWNRKSHGSQHMLSLLEGRKPVVEVYYQESRQKGPGRPRADKRPSSRDIITFTYQGMRLIKPTATGVEYHELSAE